MAAAQADVFVIGPQDHLSALLQNLAVFVEPGVEHSLFAAPADGLDLLQLVSHHQQLVAAGEQLSLEVRPQSVADHGDPQIVHHMHQIVHFLLGEELGLVHNDTGVFFQRILGQRPHFVEVDAGVFQTDTGMDHVVSVPLVHPGLHQQGLLAPLLIVEPGHQSVGRFAGAHGPVFEIKLCHLFYSPSFASSLCDAVSSAPTGNAAWFLSASVCRSAASMVIFLQSGQYQAVW